MKARETASCFSLKESLESGPPPAGNLAVPIFHHGSMEAQIYTPEELDSQEPHTRDEIYFVARGSAVFFNGEERLYVEEGAFIFVPAGTEHRFLDFTEGFAVWVVFYGPEGGEAHTQ